MGFYDNHNHSQFSFDGYRTTLKHPQKPHTQPDLKEYASLTIAISMSRR